jgi:hypothetical protein
MRGPALLDSELATESGETHGPSPCSRVARGWSLLFGLLVRAVSTPRVADRESLVWAIAIRAMFGRERRLAFALRGCARARGKD